MWKVTNIREKELVLEAVKGSGYALKYASDEMKNDKEVVLEAVKQDGFDLKFASERLQDDKEVVLEAVKQNIFALKYASERLQNDKEVVLEAVKSDGYLALLYASKRLREEFQEKRIEEIEREIREGKTDKKSTIKPVKQSNFKIKTNKKIK